MSRRETPQRAAERPRRFRRRGRSAGVAVAAGLLAAIGSPAAAQEAGQATGAAWGAQVVPLLTHATPALYGRDLTEVYLTQPMAMGHVSFAGGRVQLQGVLNLEGWTLRRGELNAGIWGEGYVDRRHPHTFLHEAMATARVVDRPALAASLSAGRGFVPFGTDDPMARPLVKYPANHHLAQVLERTVLIAAARAGGVVGVEVAAFNGDEPLDPGDLPGLRRFGDSWASRLSLWPLPGVEVQASHARVASPEARGGGGVDHWKWSASARLQDHAGRYALLEWARTTDRDDGRAGARYGTLLGEGSLRWRGTRLALRHERTERPEEERLLDPFRSQRPHPGAHQLGLTRWSITTAAASRTVELGPLRLRPFAEVAYLRAREAVRPSFFVPEEFYGSGSMWSLSLGSRVEVGAIHARMGRYGAARADHAAPGGHAH